MFPGGGGRRIELIEGSRGVGNKIPTRGKQKGSVRKYNDPLSNPLILPISSNL